MPGWYLEPKDRPTHADFEALLGRKVIEKPLKKGEFTMDNTVAEMRDHSLVMKIMYSAVEAAIAKGFGGKRNYKNPDFRMMMASAADASLSGIKISGAPLRRVRRLKRRVESSAAQPVRGGAHLFIQ